MSQLELRGKVYDKLYQYVAFGGLTQRKTKEGEIILNLPKLAAGQGDLEVLAEDLTQVFVAYVKEATISQVKSLIKDILS